MGFNLADARKKFNAQKCNAARRGIEWRLTFPQWLEWWGEDYFRRGSGHDRLQMQRVADAGAYEIGNIRKGFPRDNARTAAKVRRNADGWKAAQELQAEIDATPACAHEAEELGDDLRSMASRRLGYRRTTSYLI